MPRTLPTGRYAGSGRTDDGRKGGLPVVAAIPPSAKNRAMRTLLVVLFDEVQSLDVTGPVEVFAGAEACCPGTYRLVTASLDGAPSAPRAA